MRIHVIGGFLLVIALAIGVFGFIQSNNSLSAVAPQPQNAPAQDPPGVINGALNPELIPDHVAYSMLFRIIANRQEESAQRSIKSYVRQVLGCDDCNGGKGGDRSRRQVDDPDVDVFIETAEEHHKKVSVLDDEAAKIKARSWPDPAPEVMAKLADLQMKNEALSAHLGTVLLSRLSAKGRAKLQHYIAERVKPGIKIVPGPQPPANSNYYQEPPPAGSAPPAHHRH